MDGGCLSSPRWVSLLVAEIFYPQNDETLSATTNAPHVQDFQAYQQYLQKRAVENDGSTNSKQTHCDGQDEIGCFQVTYNHILVCIYVIWMHAKNSFSGSIVL